MAQHVPFTRTPVPAPPPSSEPGFRQQDPAPPLPPSQPGTDTDARIEDMGAQLDRLSIIAHELHELAKKLREPATLETVKLSQTRPKQTVDSPQPAFSIGIYNPSVAPTIYLGIGGGIAEENREAISLPSGSLLVLPVGGNAIEIGARPADLTAGDAVIYVFLYKTVQPAFFGAL